MPKLLTAIGGVLVLATLAFIGYVILVKFLGFYSWSAGVAIFIAFGIGILVGLYEYMKR